MLNEQDYQTISRNLSAINSSNVSDNMKALYVRDLMGRYNLDQNSWNNEVALRQQTVNNLSAGIRTFGQGLLLGWGDELEAKIRSMVSDRSYDEIRNEINAEIDAFRQQNPKIAFTTEILGAIAPTAALYFSGAGAPVATARTASLLGRVGQGAKIGFIEGGVSGAGYADEGERTAGAITGSLIGGGLGVATGAVVGPMTEAINRWTTGKNMRFENYLNRIRTELGNDAQLYTDDDIIQRVASGEMLVEGSEQLRNMIDAFVQEGPDSQYITQLLNLRKDAARTKLINAIDEDLTDSQNRNIVQRINEDVRVTRVNRGREYNKIYADYGSIEDLEFRPNMQRILLADDSLRREFDKLSKAKEADPLYVIQGNNFIWARNPTLEEAENLNQLLKESVDNYYKAGRTQLASTLDGYQAPYESYINRLSPELETVRSNYALNEQIQQAFNTGRNIFGKRPSEVVNIINDLGDNPEVIAALRAGAGDNLQSILSTRAGVTFTREVNDTSNAKNQIFQMIYPEENVDDVLELARRSRSRNDLVQMLGGSQTAKRLNQMRLGNVASETMLNVLQGRNVITPTARFLIGKITNLAPSLPESTKRQVVDMLLTQDPEVVRRYLTDTPFLVQSLRTAGVPLFTRQLIREPVREQAQNGNQ